VYAYPVTADGQIQLAERWPNGVSSHINAQQFDTQRKIVTMKASACRSLSTRLASAGYPNASSFTARTAPMSSGASHLIAGMSRTLLAASHIDESAGGEGGVVGQQPEDGVCNFIRQPAALHWHQLLDAIDAIKAAVKQEPL